MKTTLQTTLNAFKTGNFTQNALSFFEMLGYNTEYNQPLSQKTYAGFANELTPLNETHALVSEWLYVDQLFFLTPENTTLAALQVKNVVIEAYLIFGIELKKSHYLRGDLVKITRALNAAFPRPVLILFKHSDTLTLSVINRRVHKRDDSRDVLEKVTLIKDIRLENTHRAHLDILEDLAFANLKPAPQNFVELHDAWAKVLSISPLNKRFYSELAFAFTKLVGGERKIGNKTFTEIGVLQLPSVIDETIKKEFAVRLIGRLLFCWFLKKKQLVPDELLSLIALQNHPRDYDYYHSVLEPLFFEVLNKKSENRFEPYQKDEWAKIPFLNGGLFEAHLDDFYQRNELNFSDYLNTLAIPDDWFTALFELLESYHFTVEENTPLEIAISIEPEMLGQVFENLLAEVNPETGATARKSTGSFYTPREIVDYMVDESLLAYFESTLNANTTLNVGAASAALFALQMRLKPHLQLLLSYNETQNPFDAPQTTALIFAIDNLKILDPACGSGAFPMGILHKLVFVLSKLDPKNEKWRELQKQKAIRETEAAFNIGNHAERELRLKEINNAFDNNVSNYGRKLFLIKNCIYGVDIQPIATEITKLRCFLSLIVDEKIDHDKANHGIIPLPSLEFKFVCANTLIGVFNKGTTNLFEDTSSIEQLKNLRDEYLTSYGEQKKDIKRQFEHLQTQMLDSTGSETLNLAMWQPFKNKPCSWFDADLMFGIKKGFDIVIGNPPYIDSETMVKIGLEELRNQLATTLKFTKGNWDIYIAFFEVGFNFLKDAGIITFITPDKWLSKPFGYELRKNLLNNFFAITEAGRNVFESANVDSVITFIQKKHIDFFDIYKLDSTQCIKIATFAKKELVEPYAFDWFFSDKIEILSKLESSPNKLLEIGTCENACATSDAYKLKEFVFDQEFDSTKYFKMVNTGTVGKFTSKWGVSPMTYLKDKYLFPVVDRNDFLNNFKNSYGVKSIKPKIIIKGLTLLDGCIDETGEMIAGKTTLILTENKSELSNLKFLLAFLNSKLPLFYIKEKYRGSSYNGGINFNVDMINNLPIPKISKTEQQPFINLVDKILADKKAGNDTRALEHEIDVLVYGLYGLSDEEILIVEGGK